MLQRGDGMLDILHQPDDVLPGRRQHAAIRSPIENPGLQLRFKRIKASQDGRTVNSQHLGSRRH